MPIGKGRGVDRDDWPTGRLLSTAARLVEQAWNQRLRDVGVSHAGMVVLHLLENGPATARELARAQAMSEQTMARTLAHLEAGGHVSRAVDDADRRRRQVCLSDAGRAVLREMFDRSAHLTDAAIRDGGADPAAFRLALQVLVARLADGGVRPDEARSPTRVGVSLSERRPEPVEDDRQHLL
jgi:MarR family transcriptional regulator, organic hydroperoxide resistance regulator